MNEVQVETAEQGHRNAALIAKIKKWGALLAKFVSIQIVVQVTTMLAGFMIVRTITQRQFAYYTLAITMQSVLLSLADFGIGNAIYATGGKVYQDYRRFGELVKTGLDTRKTLAMGSVVVTVPVLLFLLHKQHAGWMTIILMTVFVLLGGWFRLTNDVLTIVANIRGHIDRLQKLDLVVALGRISALAPACYATGNAMLIILIGSMAYWFQGTYLRKWAAEGADLTAPPNAEDRKTIFRVIRQQAIGTIYFSYQGQLSVFLISTYGSVRALAEIGALQKFAAAFAVISMVMTRIVLPKFVRCQDRQQLIKMLLQITVTFFALSSFCVFIAYLFPGPFVAILGRKYAYAEHDFVWVMLGSAIWLFIGGVSGPLQVKAWTANTWIAIPITLVVQAMMWHFVDLRTVKGVVILTTVPQLTCLVPYFMAARRGLNSMTATELPSNIATDSFAN